MSLGKNLAATAATGLTLLALGGCPHKANESPRVYLTETDGTPIRTTQSQSIAEEYGWNEAIVLPINREDIYNGTEGFVVNASDSDGPLALTANFYATTSPLAVNIYDGTNERNTIRWNVSLNSDSNVPRGMYPMMRGIVDDGLETITVGVVGSVSPGESYNTSEE